MTYFSNDVTDLTCEACGKPIPYDMVVVAASRGQIAKYDSLQCRRRMARRRSRSRAKANT